jgi:aryl-alcohol dehydrogenase-like predicted oxidoreductase
VVPIQGATTVPQLEENVVAATITIDEDELAALEDLPPAVGDRY